MCPYCLIGDAAGKHISHKGALNGCWIPVVGKHAGRGPMAGRSVGTGRWLATQVVVSVAAATCVAALFAAGSAPPGGAPSAVAETGKSARRVSDGAVDATVVRYDSQQQAALASMASFKPIASPVVEVATPTAMHAPTKTPRVLPPPRPMLEARATPSAPAPADAAAPAAKVENWRVVGMEIPGSATVRRYVPSSDDLLKTGGAAWSASTNVVRKVATLGGLL